MPTGTLTQEDVERFWGRDRLALAQCGLTHKTLVDYYERLRAGLDAAPLK